jgi:AraC-like DNA-binding protein
MKIYIRKMICPCCNEVVKILLEKMEVSYGFIDAGVIELKENLSKEKILDLGSALKKYELELVDDPRILLTEKIKKLIIELIYSTEDHLPINLSEYLSRKLNYNYKYLSNLFKLEEGKTIEHFVIEQKIHRAKELLTFENLSLNEAANKLNYSSMAHLSRQFKQVTGLNPSLYRKNFHDNNKND